jgi:site-specific recombinase XerD
VLPYVTISQQLRRPVSGEEERVLLTFARFLSRNMSSASVAAYQSDIRLFIESTPGVDLFRITESQEDDYISWLNRMGRKQRTVQRKGTAFRYFREFVASNNLRGKSLRVLAHPVDGSKDKIGADEFAILNSGNAVDRTLLAFLQTLRVERSRSTVRAYTADLLKFRKCVQGKSAWQQVPKQLIEDFINEEIASGLNANSSARLLSTIRSFFRWLQRNGHTVGNPTLGLRVPRANKHSPVPSVKDLGVMLSTNPPSTFSALRDVLIFELLYKCGLRLSEITALDISSLDLTQRRVTVRGRRDRRRYLDIPESTVRLLTVFLPARQNVANAGLGPLVINWRGDRLTDRSIFRIIAQMVVSGKLPEGTNPHTLRAACASHSLRSGKDVQDIRHDLGVSGVSAVLKISN